MTVDPLSKVVLKAKQDVFLNPRTFGTGNVATASIIYPASFSAETETGNIVVERDLTFWPSTTGAIKFSAGKDLIGILQTERIPDANWDYIFIGFKGVSGGHWELVDLRAAAKNPAQIGRAHV